MERGFSFEGSVLNRALGKASWRRYHLSKVMKAVGIQPVDVSGKEPCRQRAEQMERLGEGKIPTRPASPEWNEWGEMAGEEASEVRMARPGSTLWVILSTLDFTLRCCREISRGGGT